MKAIDHIDYSKETMLSTTTVGDAIRMAEEHFMATIIVVEPDNKLLGIIATTDLEEIDQSKKIKDLPGYLFRHHTIEAKHSLFEAMHILIDSKCHLLPLVKNDRVEGILSEYSILSGLSNTFMLHHSSTILIVRVNIKDYSLTLLSSIIEGEGGKILSVLTQNKPESSDIDITFNIQTKSIDRIIDILSAKNIEITSFHTEDDSLYRERYESLLLYLNI